MKPLFMWAGGKNKLLKHYAVDIPKSFDTYIEPFFGGGAVFIKALEINPNAEFVINDVNHFIVGIYRAVKEDVETFTTVLDDLTKKYLPLTKEQRKEFYYNLRQEYAYNHEGLTPTVESAILYFLMKTGFNGIWQINKNTNNRYGTPAGLLNETDSVYDKHNVMLWHKALQNTTILCGDYSQVLPYVKKNTWLFLDPPYRGGFTKYATDFADDAQKRVVDFAHQCHLQGAESWITNRDLGDSFFEDYIKSNGYNMSIRSIDVTYTAGRRKKTEEGYEAKKATEFLIIEK